MKERLLIYLILLTFLFLPHVISAQAITIAWQKSVGGNDTDSMTAIAAGANKTFVVCGASKSKKSGSKSDNNQGGFDYWVVKMDYAGNILWNKTFGGAKDDIATAVVAAADGGYLVGGSSISNKSATKSNASFKQSFDYWILKLDADGNRIWDKTFGGNYTDKLTALAELPSGKLVAGGYSFSDDNSIKKSKAIGSENTADYWMIILDKNGNLTGQSVYGGTSHDVLTCIAPSGKDSIYALGYSYSLKYKMKSTLPVGGNDYWIVRSDTAGTKTFEKGFGGVRSDYLTCVQPFNNGSLLAGGYSNSPASGDRTEAFLGGTDFWLVRMNTDGSKRWDKTLGGTMNDYLVSVQLTKDKGFILGGYSNSGAGTQKAENSRGGYDYWVVKTDSAGNIKWNKTLGGTGLDRIAGVFETEADKFIVAGSSDSPVSGDKTTKLTGSLGASDFWILQLDATTSRSSSGERQTTVPVSLADSFSISPNPVREVLNLTYQAGKYANAVIFTADGKLVMSKRLGSAVNFCQFPVAGLAKGTYSMVLYEKNGHMTAGKFLKE